MRILSYNIWDGGGDRLRLIADVIRGEQPDVVALQEVRAGSAAVLADALGMELVFGPSDNLFDVHVAWLSSRLIDRSQNYPLPELAKTLLEVECGGLRLFATHLTSRHEEADHPRPAEIRAILGVLAGVAGPHVLVGDFNALQPDDPIGTPPPGVEPRGDALPGAARDVLVPLARAGYVDCFRALHPREAGWTYPPDAPWLRLEYVFVSAELARRLRRCEVVTTPDARRASDHLPVVADFDD